MSMPVSCDFGGALIVQKYKTKCEKSDEIALTVDNCPAHRTSLWTAPAGFVACPPLLDRCLRPDALRLPNSHLKLKP